jgi:alpha-ketoglutarate-dependent taurine dioxygenase
MNGDSYFEVVSERGVVFLRDQHVSPQEMRELCERISILAGCVSIYFQNPSTILS